MLYHLVGNDRIWPTSLESQVQEGESLSFDGIALDAGLNGTDYPRGYDVLVSNNGTDFSNPIASGSGNG